MFTMSSPLLAHFIEFARSLSFFRFIVGGVGWMRVAGAALTLPYTNMATQQQPHSPH